MKRAKKVLQIITDIAEEKDRGEGKREEIVIQEHRTPDPSRPATPETTATPITPSGVSPPSSTHSPSSIRRLSEKFNQDLSLTSVFGSFGNDVDIARSQPRGVKAHEAWKIEADPEDVLFWRVVQTATFVLFGALILTIVLINANDFQGEKQDQLLGTTLHRSLRIQSAGGDDAVLQLQSGNSGSNRADFRLKKNGTVVFHSKNGEFVFDASVESTSGIRAVVLEATDEGIVFPDGSRMTTAADIIAGLESPTDLNLVAGSEGESSAGSVIMVTGGKERFRLQPTGTLLLREYDESGATGVPLSSGGIILSGTPPEITIGGAARLLPTGLDTENDAVRLSSSKGVIEINATDPSHSLGAEVRGIVHNGGSFVVQPVSVAGNSSDRRAASLKLLGSDVSHGTGGDVVISGGQGEGSGSVFIATETSSNVVLGGAEGALSINDGHVNISRSTGLALSPEYLDKSKLLNYAFLSKTDYTVAYNTTIKSVVQANTSDVSLSANPMGSIWSQSDDSLVYSGSSREAAVHLSAHGISLTAAEVSEHPLSTVQCYAARNGESIARTGVLVPVLPVDDPAETDELLSTSVMSPVLLQDFDAFTLDCEVSRRSRSRGSHSEVVELVITNLFLSIVVL